MVYWIVLERRRSAVLAVSAPTAPAGTRPCRPLLPKTQPKHPAQLPAAGAPRQRPQRTRGGCQIAAPLQGDARRAADRRGWYRRGAPLLAAGARVSTRAPCAPTGRERGPSATLSGAAFSSALWRRGRRWPLNAADRARRHAPLPAAGAQDPTQALCALQAAGANMNYYFWSL